MSTSTFIKINTSSDNVNEHTHIKRDINPTKLHNLSCQVKCNINSAPVPPTTHDDNVHIKLCYQ